MGHEIVYCYWCSNRILGADFEKGAAIIIGNHACCAECLPKVLASLPASQRETLLAELSKSTGPPPLPRGTPKGGTPISAGRTPRSSTSIPQATPESKTPVVLYLIGGAVLVLLILVVAVTGGGKPEKTVTRPEPPPPPPTKPVATDRDKVARDAIQKARDAARSGIDIDLQIRLWEEAVSKSERTPSSDEAAQERSAILLRRKEVYAQELQRLTDSVDGILRDDEFKKALDALASARKRHDSPDWAPAIDLKIEEVKKLEAGSAPFRQGADGLICLEAEHFSRKTAPGEHAWTLVTQPAGFTGTGAVAALPNKNAGSPKDFVTTSPRLDYRIQVAKAGKYYVWVRGYADSGTDDSIHVGLDGAETPGGTALTISIKKWAWSRRIMANANASMDIPAGLHTLNVWMREDGAIVDRILLTPDPKYVPPDPGPPETSR